MPAPGACLASGIGLPTTPAHAPLQVPFGPVEAGFAVYAHPSGEAGRTVAWMQGQTPRPVTTVTPPAVGQCVLEEPATLPHRAVTRAGAGTGHAWQTRRRDAGFEVRGRVPALCAPSSRRLRLHACAWAHTTPCARPVQSQRQRGIRLSPGCGKSATTVHTLLSSGSGRYGSAGTRCWYLVSDRAWNTGPPKVTAGLCGLATTDTVPTGLLRMDFPNRRRST